MPKNTTKSLTIDGAAGTDGKGVAASEAGRTGVSGLGLRERNKLRKDKAIRDAARRLFLENGYEATTLREVAEAADVGFGTVFSYAADKAGLLAMVFVEDLKALPALFPSQEDDRDPLDGLLAGLEKLFCFWAKIPKLSQHVLQQMEFYSGNPHVEAIVARRSQSKHELAEWIARLQAKGKLSLAFGPLESAETLFAIYTSAVREWSATEPHDVNAGMKRLEALMRLPMYALVNADGKAQTLSSKKLRTTKQAAARK